MLIRNGLRFACWFLLCLPLLSAAVQSTPLMPGFRVMGAQQGLANSAIDAIVRDHQGLVWMATEDGLIRHAGSRFTTLRHADTPWLPGNSIQALHVDAKDGLWISVLGKGVVRLDADRLHATAYDSRLHADLSDVWAIQDDGDAVWFGTANEGVLRWDTRTRKLTRFSDDPVFALEARRKIVTFLRRAPGDVWAATAAGLLRLKDNRITVVPLPIGAQDDVVYSLGQDGERMWIGTAAGLFALTAEGKAHVPAWSAEFARPDIAIKIESDAPGHLWVSTQRGLRRIVANAWRDVWIEGAQPGKPVRAMFMQSDHALWFSAPGRGVAYLRPDWSEITHWKQLPGDTRGLSSADYRALAPARGNGWWLAGTGGVLERVDADGNIAARVRGVPKTVRPKALLENGGGVLWLAGRDELIRISQDRPIRTWVTGTDKNGLPDARLSELRDAGGGRIWLSFSGWGVQLRDHAGALIKSVRNDSDAPVGLQSIDAQPDGELFAVIDGGVFQLLQGEPGFVPVSPAHLHEFDAVAIATPDLVWAHAADGLYAFAREASGWQLRERIAAEAKWQDAEAKGLRVDARGRIWLATSRGLFVFDRDVTRHFDVGNGLSNQQLVGGTLVLSADSTRAAATAENGVVTVFAPALRRTPVEPPRMALPQLFARADGAWKSVAKSGGRWRVPAGTSEIRVTLDAVAYDDPDSVRHETRLEGVDADWTDLGSADARILTGLHPGRYDLALRVVDGQGRASEVTHVRFDLAAHWWQTRMFKSFVGLLCLVLAAGVIHGFRQRHRRARELRQAREQERQHAQASAAKSTFLATLGHEIRTPMTGVLGMSELLAHTALTPLQTQRVESIRKSSEHLLRIVDDALDLSRIEAGKLEFVDAPFVVADLLAEIAEWATPLARKKGLRFALETGAEENTRVLGDCVRVRQVLMNLVGNALKFTAEGSVTLTHTVAIDGRHVFSVTDTGPGMNAEQCSRVFARFEQAEGAKTAHRHGGSGLGLAISAELVAGMGGSLSVQSVPGAGSTFSMQLPLPAAARGLPVCASQATVTPARCFDILLVEDEDTVAEVLAGMLHQAGHTVVRASNGLDALVALSQRAFDLALLDLDLPAMDGFDLARQLRSSGFPGVVIAVSARADVHAEQAALAAGFKRFLRKPVRRSDLLAAIDADLHSHAAQYPQAGYAKARVAP